MSAIRGKGWGDSHDWAYENSNNSRHSFYTCKACGAHFSHNYHRFADIFAALEDDGLHGLNKFPDKCPAVVHGVGVDS